MTISKERFEQLALEVAKEKDSNWSQSVNFYKDFAHALIKRVEKESEALVTTVQGSEVDLQGNLIYPIDIDYYQDDLRDMSVGISLIALPLVSED
mgnify:CR=1 FL=1